MWRVVDTGLSWDYKLWLWIKALLFNMGLGKVVDKAGNQQDFEVVEFEFGSGIWGFVWEVWNYFIFCYVVGSLEI